MILVGSPDDWMETPEAHHDLYQAHIPMVAHDIHSHDISHRPHSRRKDWGRQLPELHLAFQIWPHSADLPDPPHSCPGDWGRMRPVVFFGEEKTCHETTKSNRIGLA